MARQTGTKLVAENRRARHDYHLLDRYEAGLVLVGTEVKSLREGRANLARAYADVREGGLTLVPTKLYFKDGRAKVELALARGKETRDKRRDIARREADRQIERALKARR